MKNKIISILVGIVIISFFMVSFGRSAIQSIAGLAVAYSSTLWNNVRDASVGDNMTSGIMATSPTIFDGTNFDRVRGDTTNGMDVDVTRVQGNVSIIGTETPADNYANPTDHLGTWALLGLFDGTTWDRVLESVHADNLTTAYGMNIAGFNYLFNGTNWDRIRGDITNGIDVDVTRVQGNVSVIGTETPADSYANPIDHLGTWSLLGVYNGTTWDRATGKNVVGYQDIYPADISNIATRVTTNTSTLIPSNNKILVNINVNAAGTGSTVTMYDDSTLPCDTGFVAIHPTDAYRRISIRHHYTNGICALTAGTSPADLTFQTN